MELTHPIIADTDYLSDYLAGTPSAKQATFHLLREDIYVVTTSISVSELYYGRYRRKWQEKRYTKLDTLISTLTVFPFALEHSKLYGELRAFLVDKGLDIGFADTAIASIALVEDLPVLTANVNHFNRVQDLQIKQYR